MKFSKRLKEFEIGNKISGVALSIFAVIQIFPLWWLFNFSLKDNAQIYNLSAFALPEKMIWQNYVNVFESLNMGQYLMNSVLVTAATLLITVLFSSMASYAATRMSWIHGDKIIIYFVLGIMIPMHAALLPIFILFKNLGLLNNLWALVIVYSAFSIPQAVFIFSGFMRGLPKELEEAATIDGCNIFQTFFMIIMPLLKPIIATVSIFIYLYSWNELMFALTLMSKKQMRTLTVGVMTLQGEFFVDWGAIGAAMVVAVLPSLIIYALLSDKIQKSLVGGAVKG